MQHVQHWLDPLDIHTSPVPRSLGETSGPVLDEVGVSLGDQAKQLGAHLPALGDRKACEAQLALQVVQFLAGGGAGRGGFGGFSWRRFAVI